MTSEELDAIEARAHEQYWRQRFEPGGQRLLARPQVCGDALRLVAEVRRLREALERIAINSYEPPDENGRRGPLRYGYCDAGCAGIAENALEPGFGEPENLEAVRARLLAKR